MPERIKPILAAKIFGPALIRLILRRTDSVMYLFTRIMGLNLPSNRFLSRKSRKIIPRIILEDVIKYAKLKTTVNRAFILLIFSFICLLDIGQIFTISKK